ncbi:hypothetical protein M422DRAFT_29096 [Sphaerobolus stellatus SS14]|uniref:Uncharacterized protein n=1 Tax=Sphaerobolus stellatus (strain SS14) TaxID=990650 RepID=A0A0C9VV36_SPHS4|nr:hypothetical protein M422DRAFT_29096 [Sphaerobolus stellatus SS14]
MTNANTNRISRLMRNRNGLSIYPPPTHPTASRPYPPPHTVTHPTTRAHSNPRMHPHKTPILHIPSHPLSSYPTSNPISIHPNAITASWHNQINNQISILSAFCLASHHHHVDAPLESISPTGF